MVMVGLALVPSASAISVGIVAGDTPTLLHTLKRLALDVAIVISMSWLVLLWNKRFLHKRATRL